MSSAVDKQVKDVTLKVKVSQEFASLLADLHQYGPYYRSRRLIHLAALGLAFENNRASLHASLSSNSAPVENHAAETSQQAASGQETSRASQVEQLDTGTGASKPVHYKIPEGATDALGDMFDTME